MPTTPEGPPSRLGPGPPAAPAPSVQTHVLSWALVVGVGCLVLLFAFSDTEKLWQAAASLSWWALLIPIGCGALSYVVMALSYQGIAHAAGADVPFWDMVKITFVANTVNYLVSTGGLSGFAVRLYFFIRLAIAPGTAVIISLVQTFVTNVVLVLFVVVGVGYLLSVHDLHGFTLGAVGTMLGLFSLSAVLFLVLLLHRPLRRRTLFVFAEVVHAFLHRFFPRHKPGRVRIWRFQRNLNRGIDFLLARKQFMVVPVLWIVIDWIVTLLILWGAFLAVHYPLPLTFVVVGFAVGIVLSMVSFVPGGLGIMEGSMAAIFASLGVPFETAVVAALIFRVAYYFLPMVVSVFFFRGMLIQGTHAPEVLDSAGG